MLGKTLTATLIALPLLAGCLSTGPKIGKEIILTPKQISNIKALPFKEIDDCRMSHQYVLSYLEEHPLEVRHAINKATLKELANKKATYKELATQNAIFVVINRDAIYRWFRVSQFHNQLNDTYLVQMGDEKEAYYKAPSAFIKSVDSQFFKKHVENAFDCIKKLGRPPEDHFGAFVEAKK
ncbi:MAG: hypothetical protein COA43_11570 [Robiginitomaculum sp.]|nr:MAG: hypothetical protein COA43_11570 [Robiginitomaculum sp.]